VIEEIKSGKGLVLFSCEMRVFFLYQRNDETVSLFSEGASNKFLDLEVSHSLSHLSHSLFLKK
jgi:hypothetical protein